MDLEDAEPIAINVDYENLPCSNCLQTGHRAISCHQTHDSQATSPPRSNFYYSPPPPKPDESGILGQGPHVSVPLVAEVSISLSLELVHGQDPSPPVTHLTPFEFLDLCTMKDPFKTSDHRGIGLPNPIGPTLLPPTVEDTERPTPTQTLESPNRTKQG